MFTVRKTLLAGTRPYSQMHKACMNYLDATHVSDRPAPEIAEKLDRYAKTTVQTYGRPNIILTHGKKCKVYDNEGREYLDFSAGIAVNALGHADEGVQQALFEQSGKLVHCSNLFHNEWAGELAYLITQKTREFGGLGYAPGSKGDTGLKVFLTNSGTESNEGALKFARKYGKYVGSKTGENYAKHEVVSFASGFHGRSFGALSATWNDKYQQPFAPLVPGFIKGEYNNISQVDSVVTDKTCAVIIEPIQGEGGILEADEAFMRKLRQRCDEVGAVLIFDEIQCGLSRSGTFWTHSRWPVDCHPDIVTMAKPLANGIPIGAILVKDKVADVINLGDHGNTFGGAPLQTRVAHHVLNRIADKDFIKEVQARSETLNARLNALGPLFPRLVAGSARGRGLIMGISLKSDDYVTRIVKLMRERGVIVLSCGRSTIRFLPSLIVTDAEINHCVDVLEGCLVILDREAEGL